MEFYRLQNEHNFIGLNNILFIIRYIHTYIQTIQFTIGSDGKHSAYMKDISWDDIISLRKHIDDTDFINDVTETRQIFIICGAHTIFMTWRYPLNNSDVMIFFLKCLAVEVARRKLDTIACESVLSSSDFSEVQNNWVFSII